MINRINENIIKVLENITDEKIIDKALLDYKKFFIDMDVEDMEKGFNSWLVHDYKVDNKYLFEGVVDSDLTEIFKESLYSVYKIYIEKEDIFFVDVFTNKYYKIQTEEVFREEDLISVRLYPIENHYIISDDIIYYPMDFLPQIKNMILSRYNEVSGIRPVALEDFIKSNKMFIYQISNIIEFYEKENDTMVVYTAKYTSDKNIFEAFLTSDNLFLVEDDDIKVFSLLHENVQIAEITIEDKKIEIEANTQQELEEAKLIMEKYDVRYIGEEILSLDDLLT